MPRMDGVEVVRQARSRPTDNPPYLIMLTSKARRDDLLTGFTAGANDYLLKPFDLGELLARVAAGRRVVELQTALNDRLAAQRFQSQFHQIAAHISASLTAVLDEADFDQAVNTALRQLGELFAADRSYLFRFSPDLGRITNTHEWAAPGVASQTERNQNLDADALSWWKTRMLRKEPVQIPDTAALPPEAAAEKEMFLEQEIRSLLCLPTIGGDGQLTGFIGFDRVNRAYEWSPEETRHVAAPGRRCGGHHRTAAG
jgi:CheY-like chemotaxis protein